MNRILGFDVSSVRTGFSILKSNSDGSADLVGAGTIEPPRDLNLAEKLVFFRKYVVSILTKSRPTVVVIEDIFIRQITSAIVLARFSGVLIETIKEVCGVDPILMTVTHARRAIRSDLKNDKERAFQYVVDRYGFSGWSFNIHNDIADSIILALAVHKDLSKCPSLKK